MEPFSFGVFTDVQYSKRDTWEGRYYRLALDKTRRYLQAFQQEKVSFIIHLGDLIDSPKDGYQCAREITHVIEAAGIPCCYVVGNHDTGGVPLPRLAPLWGWQKDRAFGSFQVGSLHFIVLDTNYDASDCHYTPDTHIWYESYLSSRQLEWLKQDLTRVKEGRIIVLSHALLDDINNPHAVRNGAAVRQLLEGCGRPVVVLQGHMHSGYTSETKGISYFTLPATVENESDYCYWIVCVERNGDVIAQIHTHRGQSLQKLF